MNESPLQPAAQFYPHRHASLRAELQAALRRSQRVSTALLLLGSLIVIFGYTLLRGLLPAWPLVTMVAVFLLALYLSLDLRRIRARLERLVFLYEKAIGRLDGSKPQSGHLGEEFREPAHLYDRDLTILGPDSLFGLLATVRTGVGQRGLAKDLLRPEGREQTIVRQQAIRELTGNNDLRERIHLLGASAYQQVPATFFDTWLAEPPPSFAKAVSFALFTTTSVFLALLAAGIFNLAPWSDLRMMILGILMIQAAIALSVRKHAARVLDAASGLANQMAMFSDGLALLQAGQFEAPLLIALQRVSRDQGDAVLLLKKIQRQFVIVEQRTKNFFLVMSLLFAAGTHAAAAIAKWKRENAAAMTQWLAAWAEFEALNALATFAYEHPGYIYPEILPEGSSHFEATALAHPLLPAGVVANDIQLNDADSLLLISGSNMAGKSTLLRAIGLNAVLAAAGAPVRAEQARIAPMQIGASLALTDSLAEGKSKFLAEVERLHAILIAARTSPPMLFLIDEIFSGTNSLDRRVAAEAVARALIESHAIGALSTHDLTLTEMAADPLLRAVNVHMASPDPGDPLAFDYRLKPGVNPSSNALAILRLIGIQAARES